MKNKFLLNILGMLMAVVGLFVSCQKEDPVTLEAQMDTWDPSDITSTSAIIKGLVVAQGDGFSEYGIYWGLNTDPASTGKQEVITDIDKSVFKTELTGLEHLTKYYYVAYVKTTAGEVKYGKEISFTTLAHVPTVTSDATASNITTEGATITVQVPYDGKSEISEKGLCYSLKAEPTVADTKVVAGKGTGDFTGNLTKLRSATTYYVRAYATNGVGTTYGPEIELTTLDSSPYVEIREIIAGETDGTVLAMITYNGGQAVTAQGIIWGTDGNLTLNNDHKAVTADSVVNYNTADPDTIYFSHKIEGLSANSTYHVSAYATNNVGTNITESQQFQTFPPELYMTGSGVGLDAEDWNWHEPLQLIPVHSHPELFWKIVWMKGAGEFKLAPQAAWGGDFGKTGDATNGVFAKGGDNIPVPETAGYYMVVVNLAKNTIEITEPKVYGIGGAFGGWDASTAANLFTVDNANQVIKFDGVPNADELRMHVAASTLECDWWQAEFIILDGKIAFRGTGGDQDRLAVKAGDNISLNFKTGVGSVTTP